MGAVHFLHCAHLSGLSSPPGLSSHLSNVDKHSVLDFWNYRRFSVDNFHHVKLPTGRPGGRLVSKQPDGRPGSSELAPVHLHHTCIHRMVLVICLGTDFWSKMISGAFIFINSNLSRKVGSNFKVAPHLHICICWRCPYSGRLNLKFFRKLFQASSWIKVFIFKWVVD